MSCLWEGQDATDLLEGGALGPEFLFGFFEVPQRLPVVVPFAARSANGDVDGHHDDVIAVLELLLYANGRDVLSVAHDALHDGFLMSAVRRHVKAIRCYEMRSA